MMSASMYRQLSWQGNLSGTLWALPHSRCLSPALGVPDISLVRLLVGGDKDSQSTQKDQLRLRY